MKDFIYKGYLSLVVGIYCTVVAVISALSGSVLGVIINVLLAAVNLYFFRECQINYARTHRNR